MQDTWTKMGRLPDSVRAATIGIVLLALALCAWALTPGHDGRRVPVAPVFQSETSSGGSAPVAASGAETTIATVVSVAQVDGAGSQSMDVSAASSASAPHSDVNATASADQSSTQTNHGTGSVNTSESTSEHHSSTTTSGDGSTSVHVEVNKTSSNAVVSSGPDQGNGSTSNVVSHISSHVGSTAG